MSGEELLSAAQIHEFDSDCYVSSSHHQGLKRRVTDHML